MNEPAGRKNSAAHQGWPADALEFLFEQYADRIYRLALSLLGDPALAEDVVQNTFLSALNNLEHFQNRSSVSTWLYRIAYNASVDQLRQRDPLPLPEDDPMDEDHENLPMPQALIEWQWIPETLIENRDVRRQMLAAIQTLSPSLRSVFILRDVEEMSTEETAAILGIQAGAVKVRLHRARLELREILSEVLFPENNGERS